MSTHALCRTAGCVECNQRPDHDSLFTRFEQLDELLETAFYAVYTDDMVAAVRDARKLVKLIRAQVLK